MNREILEHVERILLREPTRTLSLATLHRRVHADLGAPMTETGLSDILARAPDRFALASPREPLLDHWPEHERAAYLPVLQAAGLHGGAAVMLLGAAPDGGETAGAAGRGPGSGSDLDRVLMAAHSTVLALLGGVRDDEERSDLLASAVARLDALRLQLEA